MSWIELITYLIGKKYFKKACLKAIQFCEFTHASYRFYASDRHVSRDGTMRVGLGMETDGCNSVWVVVGSSPSSLLFFQFQGLLIQDRMCPQNHMSSQRNSRIKPFYLQPLSHQHPLCDDFVLPLCQSRVWNLGLNVNSIFFLVCLSTKGLQTPTEYQGEENVSTAEENWWLQERNNQRSFEHQQGAFEVTIQGKVLFGSFAFLPFLVLSEDLLGMVDEGNAEDNENPDKKNGHKWWFRPEW